MVTNGSVLKNGVFHSPSKGRLESKEVVSELVGYIQEESEAEYRLVIGTDSKDKLVDRKKVVDFVSAIVIHRRGRGGRYFWRKVRDEDKKSAILRNKIYEETWLSLQLAEELVPVLKEKLNGEKYDLEIHIDVGNKGPTREMIKEVVGMVTGNGYVAKTKPESFGASAVADKHT